MKGTRKTGPGPKKDQKVIEVGGKKFVGKWA